VPVPGECDNFSHYSFKSHFVSNTPGHYDPTAFITSDDTSRKIPPIQDPYVSAGVGESYTAGPPFDICNAEPSNLATGNEILQDFSDWLSPYGNAGVHFTRPALQITTDTLTIGGTSWNTPHVLDPFSIDSFESSYATGSPFSVHIADPSNLATGSALHYNSSAFVPQSAGTEAHPSQFPFHTAPTASTLDKFACSRCGKAFKRKGDLTRHGKSHGVTKFYCIYVGCPRHVYTQGFHRKDKLVDHLESSHKMTKEDAKHWAT
jgi:uncharacterized C2H2 Zn-finger protein